MKVKSLSEDDVFEAYANGLPEGFKPDYSKARRNRFIQKESDEQTIQISLKIEAGVVEQLKELAHQKGIGYQTLLKQFVRDGIERMQNPLSESTQKEVEASIMVAVKSVVQAAVLKMKSEATASSQA